MFPILHDVEIYGIEYDRINKILILKLYLLNNTKARIQIDGVFGWDLSPFLDQNIVFAFRVYDKDIINAEIITKLDVNPGYVQWIAEESGILIDINSSIGLHGYIVAKNIFYSQGIVIK